MSTLVIQLLVAAGIFVAGAAGGIRWHAGQDAIAENARQVNVRAAERLRRQNSNTAAVAHESDKIVIRKEFIPITQEVERVVTQIEYRDRACLPADGLRIINAAIARANADPGQPGDRLPAAAATD